MLLNNKSSISVEFTMAYSTFLPGFHLYSTYGGFLNSMMKDVLLYHQMNGGMLIGVYVVGKSLAGK